MCANMKTEYKIYRMKQSFPQQPSTKGSSYSSATIHPWLNCMWSRSITLWSDPFLQPWNIRALLVPCPHPTPVTGLSHSLYLLINHFMDLRIKVLMTGKFPLSSEGYIFFLFWCTSKKYSFHCIQFV